MNPIISIRTLVSFFLIFLFNIGCAQKNDTKTALKTKLNTQLQEQLKNKISEISKGKKATVAVSVLGIDFPFQVDNENAQQNLPMLSVFKFHIGLATLNLVDEGKLSLDKKYAIKRGDIHENTYSPLREKFPTGNVELTLDELIYYTVALSDNNTTDILLKIIGGTEVVQNFMDSKNVKNFQIKCNEELMHENIKNLYLNYTTTQSLSQLLKDFYNGKVLSKSSTEYLYKVLQKTNTGVKKLVEQLPPNTVAHKTGSSGTNDGFTVAENDAGIVTLPDGNHYAITVFVSNSREKEEVNTKIVSDISKAVWDYFSTQMPSK